jgi:hypothetical protein
MSNKNERPLWANIVLGILTIALGYFVYQGMNEKCPPGQVKVRGVGFEGPSCVDGSKPK